MKVSILIPIYNSESFLGDTIDSVLNQTYQNIEIILVDDGSTDNSLNIAKQFECEKIKVYSQSNQGAAAARNKAFEYATGDYIQYLDADDILHPNKIEYQIRKFQKINNNNAILNSQWGRFENSINDVTWEDQKTNKDYPVPINWLIDSWNGGGMAAIHGWLIPRNLIEKAGPWNTLLSLNDDGEFICRIILKASEILFVKESKAFYRSNINTSISRSSNHRAIRSELMAIQLCSKHCLEEHYSNTLKHALGNSYLLFIYHYHNTYPDLAMIAQQEFYSLNIGSMWPVGSGAFKKVSKILGFNAALWIKKILT